LIHILRFVAIILSTVVVALLIFVIAAYVSGSDIFSPRTWTTNVVFSIIITASLLGAGIGFFDLAFNPVTGTVTIPSSGVLLFGEAEFGVYWDVTATNEVMSVEWGVLAPGDTKTVQFWVKNNGNSNLYCELGSNEWLPLEAEQYFDLTWDFGDLPVGQYRSRWATLELHVHSDIANIDEFNFNIIIYGSIEPFT